jgi:hypothetical protein
MAHTYPVKTFTTKDTKDTKGIQDENVYKSDWI